MKRTPSHRFWPRSVAALLLLFLFSARAWAQKTATITADANFSAAILPSPRSDDRSTESAKGGTGFRPEVAPRRRGMSRAQRKIWVALAMAEHGAAAFDAQTTRAALSEGYRELDPLLAPFAHSAAIYPAAQVPDFGLDWIATKMATSRHRWLRRLWWLPQAAATAGSVWAGVHNLGLPAHPGVTAR